MHKGVITVCPDLATLAPGATAGWGLISQPRHTGRATPFSCDARICPYTLAVFSAQPPMWSMLTETRHALASLPLPFALSLVRYPSPARPHAHTALLTSPRPPARCT